MTVTVSRPDSDSKALDAANTPSTTLSTANGCKYSGNKPLRSTAATATPEAIPIEKPTNKIRLNTSRL
ncbi:Uncharacterised protein [Vibrio cholerae]|nr:Uncharacterised protein [Vibrio cholerae]